MECRPDTQTRYYKLTIVGDAIQLDDARYGREPQENTFYYNYLPFRGKQVDFQPGEGTQTVEEIAFGDIPQGRHIHTRYMTGGDDPTND